jgi:hypothetical protein
MAIWDTPLYRRWSNIRARCTNPNNEKWEDYGGRGIVLCERWQTYENFAQDMGEQPSPVHTVGRRDNDGPYSPENCRWETPIEQNNNKRTTILVSISGVTKPLAVWCRELSVSAAMVHMRVSHQEMTYEQALVTPKMKKVNTHKKVAQVDMDGCVVQQFGSLKAAAAHIKPDKPKTALKAIWRVLSKERDTYQGYSWVYVE